MNTESIIELVDKLIEEQMVDTFTPAAAGQAVFDYLVDHYPRELNVWLRLRGPEILAIQVRHVAARSREVFRDSGARAFANASPEGKGSFIWDAWFNANELGERKPLHSLSRPELQFVAEDYRQRKESNAMREAFVRALCKRLTGGQRVSDCYTKEQIQTMWESTVVAVDK